MVENEEEKTEIAWITLLSGNGGLGVGFFMLNPGYGTMARSLLCLLTFSFLYHLYFSFGDRFLCSGIDNPD